LINQADIKSAGGVAPRVRTQAGLFGELSSVDLERPFVLGFADLA